MNLEFGTRAIIALAWAREFSVPDTALQPDREGASFFVPSPGSNRVEVLRLGEHQVVRAPADILPLLSDDPQARFLDDRSLLGLLRTSGLAPSVRSLGIDALTYLDSPFEIVDSEAITVSTDVDDLAELRENSPHDDAASTTLDGCDQCFVLFSDAGSDPVAGAGYWAPGGLLAETTVLTHPGLRRHGLGRYAAALAVDDALSEGLIPQARIREGQDGAGALAASLGFERLGSLLTLKLHDGL